MLPVLGRLLGRVLGQGGVLVRGRQCAVGLRARGWW